MTDVERGAANVRTSHAEELLYGPYAPFVKLMGQASVSLMLLGGELGAGVAASHEADAMTGPNAVADPHPENRFWEWDERGRSPQTQWLESVYEEMHPLIEQVVRANRKLASDCIGRWTETRDTIHSMQVPQESPGDSGPAVSSAPVSP